MNGRALYVAIVALLIGAAIAAWITTTAEDSRNAAAKDRDVAVYESQVAGCERGNVIRNSISRRVVALESYAVVVSRNPTVVPRLQRAAAKLAEKAGDPILPVDCLNAFPRP